jgi:hypothetical protein
MSTRIVTERVSVAGMDTKVDISILCKRLKDGAPRKIGYKLKQHKIPGYVVHSHKNQDRHITTSVPLTKRTRHHKEGGHEILQVAPFAFMDKDLNESL